MSIIERIKGWFKTNLISTARDEYGIEPIKTAGDEAFIDRCAAIYKGYPDWVNEDRGISTVKFAKAVCSETARLVMLDTHISITGSERADWLQEQLKRIYNRLRDWVEFGCAYGMIILKPNGKNVDAALPGEFFITAVDGDMITGAAFVDKQYVQSKKKWYTKLEYHHFEPDGSYTIENRCFVANSENGKGKPINISDTPWGELDELANVQYIDKPLFAVFRMPGANDHDERSPSGLPIFADAIVELRDLDIAYSENAYEIKHSRRTVMLDADMFFADGAVSSTAARRQRRIDEELPEYIKLVNSANGSDEVYHEISPTLNTEVRKSGINFLLSLIGYKCGYSNGYFTFNEKTGFTTATQVEADDRRTIQLIKDIRDKVESCLENLVYALDKFADLFDLAPRGAYEITFDFGDITYNREEDRKQWWAMVVAGKMPYWRYLVKFEGFTEEDAKALESEAKPKLEVYGEYE